MEGTAERFARYYREESAKVKHLEKQVIPATEKEVCVRVTCDFCLVEPAVGQVELGAEINWSDSKKDSYYIRHSDNTCISREVGTRNNDGGCDLLNTEIHCCPACWELKLMPAIIALGARVPKPTRNEY